MKLIIDINEIAYKNATHISSIDWNENLLRIVKDALQNGTLLPKGHGRLIDESKIRTINHYHTEKCLVGNFYHDLMFDVETDAPTIIEADKEQTE